MREAKSIVKQAQQVVDLALNRAYKAETRAAEARSIADEAANAARVAQDRAWAAEEHKSAAMKELELLRYSLQRQREAEERADAAERREAMLQKELDSLRLVVQNFSDENDRLRARCSRSVSSAQQEIIDRQHAELCDLRQRRANNMAATRELNLERQRSKRAQSQVYVSCEIHVVAQLYHIIILLTTLAQPRRWRSFEEPFKTTGARTSWLSLRTPRSSSHRKQSRSRCCKLS